MSRRFIVRKEHGRVIARRLRATGHVNQLYSWTNDRERTIRLSYEQAKGVKRRYGGRICRA